MGTFVASGYQETQGKKKTPGEDGKDGKEEKSVNRNAHQTILTSFFWHFRLANSRASYRSLSGPSGPTCPGECPWECPRKSGVSDRVSCGVCLGPFGPRAGGTLSGTLPGTLRARKTPVAGWGVHNFRQNTGEKWVIESGAHPNGDASAKHF